VSAKVRVLNEHWARTGLFAAQDRDVTRRRKNFACRRRPAV